MVQGLEFRVQGLGFRVWGYSYPEHIVDGSFEATESEKPPESARSYKA